MRADEMAVPAGTGDHQVLILLADATSDGHAIPYRVLDAAGTEVEAGIGDLRAVLDRYAAAAP